MKTALDWLFEQMPYEFRANHTQEIFKQAKEKEKEQIKDAFESGMGEGVGIELGDLDYDGEFINYYNETYNNGIQ
jgi:hypothetical protein